MGEVEDQHGADQVHGHPAGQVEPHELHVRLVPEEDPHALHQAQLALALLELGLLPGRAVDEEPRQRDHHAVADGGERERVGRELASSHGLGDRADRDGRERAQDRARVAEDVHRGAAVVGARHLGDQRQVGHREDRHGQRQHHVPEGVVGEACPGRVEGRLRPEQREGHAERDGADQEEGAGIGQWNDEEILNAVQHGISKDGRGLRVMPYPWFSNLTKDDAKAIVEYLRSVPPINHKVPKNEAISIFTKVKSGLRLITPFVRNPSQDWYYGDYGVLIGDLPEPKISLFPEPQPITFTAPEAIKTSPQIEKGRYLVSISLCAGCHTPVSTRGFYEDKMLAGGFEIVDPACGTVYAQNLTPDKETGLGNWTDKEIIRAIKNGISKDGRTLCGQIMPYEFYTKFTDEDVLAIITYLKALKPIKHAIPDPTPPIGNEIPAQQFVVGDAGFVEVTDDEDSMDAF